MTFKVYELRRAQADVRSIAHWLAGHSPQGARAWLRAYDDMVGRLEEQAPSCGPAYESDDCEFDVRQAFGTAVGFLNQHDSPQTAAICCRLYFRRSSGRIVSRTRRPTQ